MRPAVYFPYGIACVQLRKVVERRPSPAAVGVQPTPPARDRDGARRGLLTWRQHERIDVFHVENSSLEIYMERYVGDDDHVCVYMLAQINRLFNLASTLKRSQ